MHWLSQLLTIVSGWGVLILFLRGLRCAIFHKSPSRKDPEQ